MKKYALWLLAVYGMMMFSTSSLAAEAQSNNKPTYPVAVPQNIDPSQYVNKKLGIMKIDPDTVAAQNTIPPQPSSQTSTTTDSKATMGISTENANQMLRKGVQSDKPQVDPDATAAQKAASSINNPIINVSGDNTKTVSD